MACGSSQADASAGRRQLRTHKFLPHPQQTALGHDHRWRTARPCQPSFSTLSNTAALAAHASVEPSSQILEQQPRRLGPDLHLPPTPPTRSHASSSSHSIAATSPTTDGGNGMQLAAQTIVRRQLATPPDRSPPTPDETPPQPVNVAVGGPRSNKREGGYWLNRKAPDSSNEAEHGKFLVRPPASISVPRPVVGAPAVVGRGNVQSHALGVMFGHRMGSPEARLAPCSREEVIKFDGSRSSASRSKGREEEDLERMDKIASRRSMQPPARGRHPVEDGVTVKPSNATKAARQMVPREASRAPSPPKDPIQKPQRAPSAPLKRTKADGQATAIQRVASAPSRPTRCEFRTSRAEEASASVRSSSNVVEVLLMDGPPRRRKTLRHVRKQSVLREPLPDEQDPMADRAGLNRSPKPPRVLRSTLSDVNSRHESCVSALSNKTSRSISSNRARREIWRSGAIPVVVVPERRSSLGPKSGEPSLRSMSSRRSTDSAPVFERRCHRSRRHSDSDRWGPTTVDCPHAIPPRSSSLSAPTSRNVSRAPSIQSSIRRKGGSEDQPRQIAEPKPVSQRREEAPPSPCVGETVVVVDGHEHGFSGYDEALSPRKFSSLDTPFSVVSMETCGTAPELSEAQVVHMVLHQNSSILMVNNSGRPTAPRITRTKHRGDGGRAPETPPPRQAHKLLEADSPLRNPRDPPQPPKCPPVIPRAQERPPRQLDMVKRALSRRRHSVDDDSKRPAGSLTRTLSLSRHTGREEGVWMERSCTYPRGDETEGGKPSPDHWPLSPMRSLSVTASFRSGGRAQELRRSSTAPRRKQTPPPPPSQHDQLGIGVWRNSSAGAMGGTMWRFSIGSKLEEMQKLPQTIRERRREKRTQRLRVMISGPRDVRDGVGEVIRRGIERVKV